MRSECDESTFRRKAFVAFGATGLMTRGARVLHAPSRRTNLPGVAPDDPVPSPKQAIQMLTDRVLVLVPRSEGERRSKSGILIPATAEIPRRLSWAEVVATGPLVRSIKPGDQVLFNPEDRFEVEVQGENYLILRERDIHAVAAERVKDSTGLYL